MNRESRVTSWVAGLPYVLIAAGALLRIVPHPPNFAPIAAIALFGGAVLPRRLAVMVPVAALAFSDLVIGAYSGMAWVYGSFILIALIGMTLRRRRTLVRIAATALASSVLFFLITNFGEWFGPLYPHTPAGLWADYVAAIPFFHNTVLSDLAYSLALFGVYESALRLARRRTAVHAYASTHRMT